MAQSPQIRASRYFEVLLKNIEENYLNSEPKVLKIIRKNHIMVIKIEIIWYRT